MLESCAIEKYRVLRWTSRCRIFRKCLNPRMVGTVRNTRRICATLLRGIHFLRLILSIFSPAILLLVVSSFTPHAVHKAARDTSENIVLMKHNFCELFPSLASFINIYAFCLDTCTEFVLMQYFRMLYLLTLTRCEALSMKSFWKHAHAQTYQQSNIALCQTFLMVSIHMIGYLCFCLVWDIDWI